MNINAKKFIATLDINECKECNDYKLAYSCKITKNEIVTDRICIVYIDKNYDTIIYVLHKLSNNKKIEEWLTNLFIQGKTIIFSFTDNTRKIYIERLKDSNEHFFTQSVEWVVGNEDNYIKRDYITCEENPLKYKDLIPNGLFKYLSFNTCLLRTDGQLYIRHKNNVKVLLTLEIGHYLMEILSLIQENNKDKKKFMRWLYYHCKQKAIFNWIQITKNSMTVYVC